MDGIVDFLFEVGILNELPRSGCHFLGVTKQNVAEHSFRIAVIAYCLAKLAPDADEGRLVKMCLLHDIVEARTGDMNYVQKKYVKVDEDKALRDQAARLPFGDDYIALVEEFNAAQTREAQLAKDADQLELMLVLKRTSDLGNKDADKWMPFATPRLRTEEGKKLGAKILSTASDRWWFDDDKDWWVHAGKKKKNSET